MPVTKYLEGRGPLTVNITGVVAVKTAIFDAAESGKIKHLFWLEGTNGQKLSLVTDDGSPIFKFTVGTGALAPFFLNLDQGFANGLYCDDLDGGEVWIVLSSLMPNPRELKV